MDKGQFALLCERIPKETTKLELENDYNNLINSLLKDSKYIALSIIFPYEDYSEMELPKKYYNWQIRASVEIYNSLGTSGIKSYSENGISWSKGNDYVLSNTLMNELIPKVGIPKRREGNV